MNTFLALGILASSTLLIAAIIYSVAIAPLWNLTDNMFCTTKEKIAHMNAEHERCNQYVLDFSNGKKPDNITLTHFILEGIPEAKP